MLWNSVVNIAVSVCLSDTKDPRVSQKVNNGFPRFEKRLINTLKTFACLATDCAITHRDAS